MMLGLGLSLSARGSAATPAFDPATLSLSGWWRASYAGVPWTGVASAGGSGGRQLTQASGTLQPAVGTALNGFTPADLDGSNDEVAYSTVTNLITAAAGSIAVLFNADSAQANAVAGQPYVNPLFFIDHNTDVCIGFADAGIRCGLFTTSWKELTIACATGGWHLAQMKWDSTNLKMRLDGGAWSSVAVAAMNGGTLPAGVAHIGRNSGATKFFDGKMAELITATTALSDANFDSIKSYINSRYALSL